MPRLKPVAQEQDPNGFLDRLLEHMKLKNDAAMSRALGVPPPVLSKFRHGRNRVGASFLIVAHDHTGLTLNQLREWLNVPPAAAAVE